MLKPTDAELAQAKDLGIDPGNMNGPQLRKEIGLALRRERVIRNPESARSETFKRLSVVARSLRLPAIPHEQMAALKARIETRLAEVFDQKGIKAGVTVQYGPGAREHAGKKALIERTDILWMMDMPHIVIKMEGASKNAHTYYAHPIALHATVVSESK